MRIKCNDICKVIIIVLGIIRICFNFLIEVVPKTSSEFSGQKTLNFQTLLRQIRKVTYSLFPQEQSAIGKQYLIKKK